MNTVKFLKDQGSYRKGKLYNVTSRYAEQLAKQKIAEVIQAEKKEDKSAASRKTK
jgi:hypothetical protein